MPAANQPIVTRRQVPAYAVQPQDTNTGGTAGAPDYMPNVNAVPGAATQPQRRSGATTQPQGKYDPNMVSTADTSDELSPTTIVLNYLKGKGLPLTAENIRRTVEANARDPGVAGPNLAGYVTPAGRDVELRNTSTEDSPMVAAMRKAMAPAGPASSVPWDTSGGGAGSNASSLPTPNAGAPPGPGGSGIPIPMPPTAPSPVGVPAVPQISPPPAGAAANVPTPTSPLTTALTRATAPSGPELPALPAPEPQLALPAPSPQLALPAPSAPTRPQIAAPPEVPQVEGPTPRLALPAPDAIPAPSMKAPPISPENPVVQTPTSRAVGRIAGGGIAGAARGGSIGALTGAGAAAAPELYNLGQYIARNLHLR